MKKAIIANVIQLLLVSFSVVLGIFLSERIEERKNEKEAALLLSKIKAEINENKALLEHWVSYHVEIVKRLDSLNNEPAFVRSFVEDQSALFEEALTRGTIMGDTPANDAWDIAKSHPLIVHFDYEKLLILSKIYKQQARTYEPVTKMIELFLSADFNTEEHAAANLETFNNQMHEIASREIQLMNYFKEAESILDLSNN